MGFDKGNSGRQEGIANRDAGMGVSRRVDNDKVDLVVRRLLDAAYDFAFVIRLKCLQADAVLLGHLVQVLVDGGQRVGTVHFGLARAQQVQIGAMDDQNVAH
jgi:hypothetical protein